MKLQQLRYAYEIAKSRFNLTHAARAVHASQSVSPVPWARFVFRQSPVTISPSCILHPSFTLSASRPGPQSATRLVTDRVLPKHGM